MNPQAIFVTVGIFLLACLTMAIMFRNPRRKPPTASSLEADKKGKQ